jgi:hypothetical protein
MPKIQWTDLPPALRDRLFERLRERKISAEDLYKLRLWRESEPEAPDGEWYKDFGTFKICGVGQLPKTFLLEGQPARGEKLQHFPASRNCLLPRCYQPRRNQAEPRRYSSPKRRPTGAVFGCPARPSMIASPP